MKKTTTVHLVLCALFAALSAILSQVSIPIGPVPITFTHVSIFLAAGLMGARSGTASQAAFVLLGIIGAPVFSGFSGGVGKLLGPTGGFIVGYIGCALTVGLLSWRFGRSLKVLVPAMCAGLLVTYALGVPWFMVSMQADVSYTLAACVLPFLPGDAVKIALSAVLVVRLYPVVQKMRGSAPFLSSQ